MDGNDKAMDETPREIQREWFSVQAHGHENRTTAVTVVVNALAPTRKK